MIIGKIHPGSGLGDQLFSYIITRVIALDKGYDFGFVGKEFFKGKDFMNLDWGKDTLMGYQEAGWKVEEPSGKIVATPPYSDFPLFEINTPSYNPEVNFVKDWSIIDGYGAQDSKYFKHRHGEIEKWLRVDHHYEGQNVCVINFRGGEYKAVSELFLSQEYWDKAIQMMKEKDPTMVFEVHTDDPETAKQFFPKYRIIQNIEKNWKAIRYANYVIISNSAFAILPALLNKKTYVIAPRYWAGRNVGEWRRPQNYYKKFNYI